MMLPRSSTLLALLAGAAGCVVGTMDRAPQAAAGPGPSAPPPTSKPKCGPGSTGPLKCGPTHPPAAALPPANPPAAAPASPPPVAPTLAPIARLDVRTIVSTQHDGDVLRAVVGVAEVYPFLVVERILRGATEGDPDHLLAQLHIELPDLAIAEGDRIEDLRWRGDDLGFHVRGLRARHICQLPDAAKGTTRARCTIARGGKAR